MTRHERKRLVSVLCDLIVGDVDSAQRQLQQLLLDTAEPLQTDNHPHTVERKASANGHALDDVVRPPGGLHD